jgi:hypothetical protein
MLEFRSEVNWVEIIIPDREPTTTLRSQPKRGCTRR